MSNGVKVFVCLSARICSCFHLALVYAAVLVLQTVALSVGLRVFSSSCPAWPLCSHCCSISEMTGNDPELCLLGLTWQREAGSHHFQSLLLQVCSPVPWEEHWDSLVHKQCWLKDCFKHSEGLRTLWFLTMEDKQVKCWLCKRQHWWRPRKSYCRTWKRRESYCLV